MNIVISLNEADLTKLVHDEIARQLGEIPLESAKIVIEVKSKQNYKSEWETAQFRAIATIIN